MAIYDKLNNLQPDDPSPNAVLAYIYRLAEDIDESIPETLSLLEEYSPQDMITASVTAQATGVTTREVLAYTND